MLHPGKWKKLAPSNLILAFNLQCFLPDVSLHDHFYQIETSCYLLADVDTLHISGHVKDVKDGLQLSLQFFCSYYSLANVYLSTFRLAP